jgi:tRNA (guanine-N7-)-methyltransferase
MLTPILKKGGEFWVASDDLNYILWTLMSMPKFGLFTLATKTTKEMHTPPAFWFTTRYEAKARAIGDEIYYLKFIKN